MYYVAPFGARDGYDQCLAALARLEHEQPRGDIKFVVEREVGGFVEKFDEHGEPYTVPRTESRSLTVRFGDGTAAWERNGEGWERHATGPHPRDTLVALARQFLNDAGDRPTAAWRPAPHDELVAAERRNGWVNPWAYRMGA